MSDAGDGMLICGMWLAIMSLTDGSMNLKWEKFAGERISAGWFDRRNKNSGNAFDSMGCGTGKMV